MTPASPRPAPAPSRPSRARPAPPPTEAAQAALQALRITHAERVVDALTGTTKGRLIAHYAAVAPLMLPHLQGRPVALLRAPQGLAGALFFQKHVQAARGGAEDPEAHEAHRAPEHPP